MSSTVGAKHGGVGVASASTSSLQATQSSSMESLESSMSTTESTAEVESVRLATVLQENTVLKSELALHKSELELMRLKCKNLLEENRRLRQASVNIQAQAEQEEEFISNTLLKKIHSLKKEKEALAMNYEQEEEYLTNDLSRKLAQLRQEKVQLEQTLEQEQEQQIAKLTKKIERLQKETLCKQSTLEQLRREKVDLENTLEQEQEMLVNKLWKRMDKVEMEKKELEARLSVTPPPSPNEITHQAVLRSKVSKLSSEVVKLKKTLQETDEKYKDKMHLLEEEERALREENILLQRRLQRETERREQLSRQLSESESSLEIEDERIFNERARQNASPAPYSPSPTRRSISPAGLLVANSVFAPPSPLQARTSSFGATSNQPLAQRRRTGSAGQSMKQRPTTR